MSFRNFPMVPRVVFGRGSFNQLGEILEPKRQGNKAPFIVENGAAHPFSDTADGNGREHHTDHEHEYASK